MYTAYLFTYILLNQTSLLCEPKKRRVVNVIQLLSWQVIAESNTINFLGISNVNNKGVRSTRTYFDVFRMLDCDSVGNIFGAG